ncbi:riboflavin synthase, partial [Clostridioides difficile]|nr:riboflavin synthase [Clostridioides difficile]
DERFKVSIIHHTKINTSLLTKNVGDFVNLESDVIGKYVNNFMANNYKELNSSSSNHKSNIDKDFLFKNGF